ncbi:hypothetical protein EW146_g7505 [Bondarzewia mesenterica]|uniref:Nucleolar complex-associated protein 3 n=1 Tax=Bondarzewia mesenterica TaxID=1095465 RepID=A0A4S4LKL4_9AGAM|nr:hypothetical protein EW146_g7505 [Bondarzewia mesenterica]
MGTKSTRKRPIHTSQGASKRRKLSQTETQGKPTTAKNAKSKGKERAFKRETIPIPNQGAEYEPELSDQDFELLDEYGAAVSFLDRLDEKGIARSKIEQDRLHRLSKPVRKPRADDDLPSIHSHSDDDEVWSSGIDEELLAADSDSGISEDDLASEPKVRASRARQRTSGSDLEMSYELKPRKRRPSWNESDEKKAIDRLPIKLADGRIQKSSGKAVILPWEDDEEESEGEEDAEEESRKMRIQGAKEQIAGICQEIVADPENSLGLLRRLHTFSLTEISTPAHPSPVPNDPMIRKLAILSQLAVFKDVLPGYRIRALTDKEKAEKVSQMVARTREWEQGLVGVYQSYLKSLDAEIKAKSELADTALRCMCTLVTDVTHFNFRENIMSIVVARLSKKSWDESSDLCLHSIVSVLRSDVTGVPSLEVVRLLNRMIKERRFNVHPNVLSCLLHLRLKTELGVRASDAKVEKEERPKGKRAGHKGKGPDPPHLSKKAKKALKERKEVEKEMKAAEAEVDKEERSSHQTETLKLLFVLYFRILKNPDPTPLLPAALQGISKFAHLVSIDFFKDLMKVLKELISRGCHDDTTDDLTVSHVAKGASDVRHRLRCVVTAFELLSGQGEALNIDLGDFIIQLYSIILSSSLTLEIERVPIESSSIALTSTDELLFRALDLAFSPRTSGSPPWRSAAFAKRLLTASLHWPTTAVLHALAFVEALLGRDTKLEALLSTEDRSSTACIGRILRIRSCATRSRRVYMSSGCSGRAMWIRG